MRAWGMTDVGLRRRENQDTYAFEVFGEPDTVVAVVCDGMGGVSGGQLASSLAVETFMGELHALAHVEMTVEQVRKMEMACIAKANRAVYDRSRLDDIYYGMGTTLVSAIASPDIAVVCNVGDSRAYHIGKAGIRRVTRDHSVVEEMVEAGEITPPHHARARPRPEHGLRLLYRPARRGRLSVIVFGRSDRHGAGRGAAGHCARGGGRRRGAGAPAGARQEPRRAGQRHRCPDPQRR